MGILAVMLAGLLGFGAPTQVAAATPPALAVPAGEVFPLDFPDPMVSNQGGTYYAYATQTPWEVRGIFPVLRSNDLHRWTYVADALAARPRWAWGDLWAPSVVERDGTYYLYFSAATGPGYGEHCVGVATAGAATGPFVDRGPLACAERGSHGYIDPAVLLDGDQAYLYFSVDVPEHLISVLPLASDLLHVAGPRIDLLGISQPWEHGPAYSTVEAPFVVRQDGLYYLLYSGNDWRHDYGMGYATSSSPTGPFVKAPANPLPATGGEAGPGGGSLFSAGGRWMLAYHAWEPAGRTLHLAPVCIGGGQLTRRCP